MAWWTRGQDTDRRLQGASAAPSWGAADLDLSSSFARPWATCWGHGRMRHQRCPRGTHSLVTTQVMACNRPKPGGLVAGGGEGRVEAHSQGPLCLRVSCSRRFLRGGTFAPCRRIDWWTEEGGQCWKQSLETVWERLKGLVAEQVQDGEGREHTSFLAWQRPGLSPTC